MSAAVTLTATQMADILRHLGYPPYGSTDDTIAPLYRLGLERILWRLSHLAQPEAIFTANQLAQINTCYTEITQARSNLSTLGVGIIQRNPNELALRRGEYRQLCRDLAAYLGVAVGPFFRNAGASRVVV